MNENIEKQEDTEKHLLDKLNVGDVSDCHFFKMFTL
jgi:hypothetical protein